MSEVTEMENVYMYVLFGVIGAIIFCLVFHALYRRRTPPLKVHNDEIKINGVNFNINDLTESVTK